MSEGGSSDFRAEIIGKIATFLLRKGYTPEQIADLRLHELSYLSLNTFSDRAFGSEVEAPLKVPFEEAKKLAQAMHWTEGNKESKPSWRIPTIAGTFFMSRETIRLTLAGILAAAAAGVVLWGFAIEWSVNSLARRADEIGEALNRAAAQSATNVEQISRLAGSSGEFITHVQAINTALDRATAQTEANAQQTGEQSHRLDVLVAKLDQLITSIAEDRAATRAELDSLRELTSQNAIAIRDLIGVRRPINAPKPR